MKTTPISLRVPQDLYTALEQDAQAKKTTKTAIILEILSQYYDCKVESSQPLQNKEWEPRVLLLESQVVVLLEAVEALKSNSLKVPKINEITVSNSVTSLEQRPIVLPGIDSRKSLPIKNPESTEKPKSTEKPNGLTESQQQAFNALLKFVKEENHKFFRLSGYAGTGKSYLVASVIKEIAKEGLKIALASPTNKAAKNLESLCKGQGIHAKVTTIAKLLKLQPEVNQKTGKQEFLTKELGMEEDEYDVIFIDEYSMISKDNVSLLFEMVSDTETQIVFIGDSAQLPPINEKQSLIENHPEIECFATLSEVVRYDGAIARAAEEIRSNYKYNHMEYPFTSSEDGTIKKLTFDEWIPSIVNLLKENIDSAKIIAWRNKTVDEYNKKVRQSLYGIDADEYLVGDILIAKSPVFRNQKNKKTILFNTSDEFKVSGEKVLRSVEFLDMNWEYWEVPVNEGRPLHILIPEYEKIREKKLEELKKQAVGEIKDRGRTDIWKKQFYPLSSEFDSIGYFYACTCHKAQGSSIENVFLDVLDIKGCPDKQKILYTALTRAKKTCYVL